MGEKEDCEKYGITSNEQIINNSVAYSCYMDFCPHCFASKVEIGSHKSHHDYELINGGQFRIPSPITNEVLCRSKNVSTSNRQNIELPREHWTAREYLFLLSAIEKHGFGNWEEISKRVNYELNNENDVLSPTYKSPSSVKEEYIKM